MTPPAATAAGRTKTRKPAKPARKATGSRGQASTARAKARPAGGRRAVRRSPAPRASRRVSGPAGGRGAAAAAAAALPRPQLAPLGPRLVAFATTLPDRGFVDRMVRGRVWIGVLAVLLIGLVFTQVSLLKLNAGIGSDVERGAGLERINGELRAQVSQLESGERIQERAAALGMVLPAAGQISYVRAQGSNDISAAANALANNSFNDPAKANTLPGSDGPPDPLEAALTQPDTSSTDGTSTDGTSTDSTSTDSTSTDGTSTNGTDTSSGSTDTSGSTDGGSTDGSGSTDSTSTAAAAAGGTTSGDQGQ